MKALALLFICVLISLNSFCQKSEFKKAPLTGTWIEAIHKTDTIYFKPEYDGQHPIFWLGRISRPAEGMTLPGYNTGPYWYKLGEKNISVDWFLSSGSDFKSYYFEITDNSHLKIGDFFSGQPNSIADTLTFTRIE
jgi:hypothetical protein